MELASCLAVGNYRPLFAVRLPQGSGPVNLNIERSTLVAGQTLLRIRPADRGLTQPTLAWRSLDSLLARYGNQVNGDMIDLQEGLQPSAPEMAGGQLPLYRMA